MAIVGLWNWKPLKTSPYGRSILILFLLCWLPDAFYESQFPLRLCLFWVKITSKNVFPYLRVFGCAWKMLFSWPVLGCKLIFVFILPSNTIFRKTERELSESEIEEEERGREHTPPASQASAREIVPRERSNPKPRALQLWLRIAPFDFAVRLRIAPRSHPSTSPANPEPFDFAPFDFVEMALGQHRSHWVRDWEMVGFWWIWPDLMNFFFVGFCFCVYLLRNGIIYLFGSWENVRNKKKMCFLYYFQQYNQTLENIFQRIFWNATKYLKMFSFPENILHKPNTA